MLLWFVAKTNCVLIFRLFLRGHSWHESVVLHSSGSRDWIRCITCWSWCALILWMVLLCWCILCSLALICSLSFWIPTGDGWCLYWETHTARKVWHREILCPSLCMPLGLYLWFVPLMILDDGYNCGMSMMLLLVELFQSYLIGSTSFVCMVLVLATILNLQRGLSSSIKEEDWCCCSVRRFGSSDGDWP